MWGWDHRPGSAGSWRLSEHDEQLRQIFDALRQLIAPPAQPKRPVGFRIRDDD